MSSPAGLDPATIIAVFSSIRIANNTGVAGLTFLVFDYLITFAQEVEFFWKPKLSGAGVIFLLNRYIVLVTMLLNVSGVVFTAPAHRYVFFDYIPWAVFAAKRASALSSKNLLFTAWVLLLSFVPVALNSLQFIFGLHGEVDPVFGCVIIDPINPDLSQNPRRSLPHYCSPVTVISRSCLIVADLCLVIATWIAVSRTVKLRTLATDDTPTFGAVLLRDGVMYFV
ncbi:hypothetical protein BD309DRAFT_1021032 [Dichomitus squalens]|uniref:DUF6533 domain-containing protein n=1 Tax=Dichomitus squalens TaxID=114155 RepID=A0A4Q9NIA3_9APHY|nr:hypothetical protein BD309DRAFT_1021032 [Dichomitus squalens]TBU61747.1 hypothetical protein BD310DRAFT_974743 [Dichomitus squalens]